MENDTTNQLSDPVVDPSVTPSPSSAPNSSDSQDMGGAQYQSPQPPSQSPRRSKKYMWIAIIVALLIAGGAVFLLWPQKTAHHVAKQTTAPVVPKVPAPLVTTAAPATLAPGTYTVGTDKNIVPGLYSVSPGPQQSGTFTVITSSTHYDVTLNYNANGDTDTNVAWTQLASGDKVQIATGLTAVTFKAVTTSPSTPPALAKLYTSSFTVTDQPHRTNPGKYHIYDKADPNVYLLVISKDNTIKYNQPLNSTGFDIVLEDGDQIAATYFTQYYMSPL